MDKLYRCKVCLQLFTSAKECRAHEKTCKPSWLYTFYVGNGKFTRRLTYRSEDTIYLILGGVEMRTTETDASKVLPRMLAAIDESTAKNIATLKRKLKADKEYIASELKNMRALRQKCKSKAFVSKTVSKLVEESND